jgi:hypothetical protein
MTQHDPFQQGQVFQQLFWRDVQSFRYRRWDTQDPFSRLGDKIQHIARHMLMTYLMAHGLTVSYRFENILIVGTQHLGAYQPQQGPQPSSHGLSFFIIQYLDVKRYPCVRINRHCQGNPFPSASQIGQISSHHRSFASGLLQPHPSQMLHLLPGCLDVAIDRSVIQVTIQGSEDIFDATVADAQDVEQDRERFESARLLCLTYPLGIDPMGATAREAFLPIGHHSIQFGVTKGFRTPMVVHLKVLALAALVGARLWRLHRIGFQSRHSCSYAHFGLPTMVRCTIRASFPSPATVTLQANA